MKRVVEIGPGIRPSKYAFDSEVEYLGIDPDMHYLINTIELPFMDNLLSMRGDTNNFKYLTGTTMRRVLDGEHADEVGEVKNSFDLGVMGNVLGDKKSYRGGYAGLYIDRRTGETRTTDIWNKVQLIKQGLRFLKSGGLLIVIEDCTKSGEVDHVLPKVFESELCSSEEAFELIDGYEIFTGMRYVEETANQYMRAVYTEDYSEYLETCFVAKIIKS